MGGGDARVGDPGRGVQHDIRLALGAFLHNWVLVVGIIGVTALGALGGRRLGKRFGHRDGLLGAGVGLLLVNGLLYVVGAGGISVLLGHISGDP